MLLLFLLISEIFTSNLSNFQLEAITGPKDTML